MARLRRRDVHQTTEHRLDLHRGRVHIVENVRILAFDDALAEEPPIGFHDEERIPQIMGNST